MLSNPFGPQAANIDALLRRASGLSNAEVLRLAEQFNRGARGRARAELAARGTQRGREAARRASAAVSNSLAESSFSPMVREAATAAVACAAMAIAVRDQLPADQFVLLYAAWSQAMGSWYRAGAASRAAVA